MIRYCLMALCLGLTSASSLAFAETVSQADQDACTPDVFRLCQEYIPDEAPIVACLEAKKVQLSPPCMRVMFPPTEQPAPVTKTHHVRRKEPAPAHHAKHKHKKPHPS